MTDYKLPDVPDVEAAYRTAFRTLGDLVPARRKSYIDEENLCLTEVISQFRFVVDEAEMTVAAQLGPLIDWLGPHQEGGWGLIAASIDFDGDNLGFGDFTLSDNAYEGRDGRWFGSPMDCAARAYKREAGWDFAPSDSGIWLLTLAPVSASGGGDEGRPWYYSGHLVGFVTLYDHDDDGLYESVGHIWTASAWRRRGIARRLLEEAHARFSVTRVLGPYTEDGSAFLRAVGELAGAPEQKQVDQQETKGNLDDLA